MPIYPEPTRDNIVLGNPAVYPPVFILLSVPLALIPVDESRRGCGSGCSADALFAALWILGVRDWRCYVIALTSPVVIHGLFYGNLDDRHSAARRARVAVSRPGDQLAGIALGAAVAAKLFAWPVVVWLVLTRRYRAAAWAVVSALVLIFGAWALIGFEGLGDYPKLLRVVQDVYAVRSISVSTVAGSLGASVRVAVALALLAGIALLGVAAFVARRQGGDRRAFALAVGACIVASPIVWPNYAALLFVPIAITWPRLSPAWFFGYVIALVGTIAPKTVADDVCCRPPDVPSQAWGWSHSAPVIWYPGAVMTVVLVVALTAGLFRRVRGGVTA